MDMPDEMKCQLTRNRGGALSNGAGGRGGGRGAGAAGRGARLAAGCARVARSPDRRVLRRAAAAVARQ